jgi:hypothetical protein
VLRHAEAGEEPAVAVSVRRDAARGPAAGTRRLRSGDCHNANAHNVPPLTLSADEFKLIDDLVNIRVP